MRLIERGGLRLLTFPTLDAIGLACAVSTRPLDVKDPDQRDRLVAALGLDPARLFLARQVHGMAVVSFPAEDAPATGNGGPPEADGLVTRERGVALFGRAADCSLLVVADPERRAVGIAHAGWRGAAKGVAIQLVRTMERLYGVRPSDCYAGVGPTISQRNYAVGPEVPAAFVKYRAWAKEYVALREGMLHLDLPGVNAHELIECGVPADRIEVAPLCTFDAKDLLFSFRREGPGCGHHGLVAGWS